MRPVLHGFLLVAAIVGAAFAQESTAPKETDLTETVGRRLVQIGVSLSGKQDRLADLTADDLELYVGGREIEDVILDRVCEGSSRPESDAPTFPATILFYIDQPFLDVSGRGRAFEMLRELIPRLVIGENRGMLVANGIRPVTHAQLTNDPAVLVAAAVQAESDIAQWDSQSAFTQSKTTAKLLAHEREMVAAAQGPARLEPGYRAGYGIGDAEWVRNDQILEWQADRNLERLEMSLGGLVEIEPPQLVVYLGDYGGFGSTAAERLVHQAIAQGSRLYAVRTKEPLQYYGGRQAMETGTRLLSADVTRATGGETFSHEMTAPAIAREILESLSCFYLLSFDAAGLPVDERLNVDLQVTRSRVKARTPPTIVVQSESKRLVSRLLGAFAAPEMVRSTVPVAGRLILTGFENGRYVALAQVGVGSSLEDSSFDIGASLVSSKEVRDDFATRITVGGPTWIVVEETIRLPTGPFELVMVAHETNEKRPSFELISTGTVVGDLRDPEKGEPFVAATSVVQPIEGTFSRDGGVRPNGAWAVEAGGTVRARKPVALTSLVCRGKSKRKALKVASRIVGEAEVPFDDVTIEPGSEPCVLVGNQIPEATLTAGGFRYEIDVWADEQKVTEASRDFVVGEK